MRNIHVFHLEVAAAGHINGVSRCIRTLVDSFAHNKRIKVTWVRFAYNIVHHIYQEARENYQIIHVPLSSTLKEIWGNADERHLFKKELLELVQANTDKECRNIIHIHTMNLIEAGLYLREKADCLIVSTIHCIPWKNLYNNNRAFFCQLYEDYYMKQDFKKPDRYVCGEYEQLTYEKSDALVCVTECARYFVRRISDHHIKHIVVIPNGLKDAHLKRDEKLDVASCLFVGGPSPSKGLDFLLQALCRVQMKYDIRLFIAGQYTEGQIRSIRKKYPFLDIVFCGTLSWSGLTKLYERCTIGVLPSLQEQCSYAAIEMMMAGMPIVSSDADGLDEMFVHGDNALVVPTRYTPNTGLRLDIVALSDAICSLITDTRLCRRLGHNAKRNYMRRFTDLPMSKSYTHLYESLIN